MAGWRSLLVAGIMLVATITSAKGQFGVSFGIPNFNNQGGRQDNNRPNNLGQAIGSILGGIFRPGQQGQGQGQGQGQQGQGNRPGQGLNISFGGIPISVTPNQNGVGISFGQNGGRPNGGRPNGGRPNGGRPNGGRPNGGGDCANNNGGCAHNCRPRRRGGVRCSCRDGYRLGQDRRSCNDFDECRRNNAGCQEGCTNTDGSYTCTCFNGGSLGPDGHSCSGAQINNCAFNNGGCQHICSQTQQGVACFCQQGFSLGRDGKSCLAVDQCTNNNGGCSDICTSTPRGPVCTCPQGKTLQRDRRTCQDLNECQFNNGGCQQICINTDGAFECQCQQGFKLVNNRFCQITQRPTQPPTRPPTRPTIAPPTQPPTSPIQGCGNNPKKSLFNRIVGGKPADPKDWPWMAAFLRRSGNTQYCGGTLITDRHVLTAAHCMVFNANEILVRLGEYEFGSTSDNQHVDFNVAEIRRHEGYNKDTQENDIAVVKLSQPATFGQRISPVCLPPAGRSYYGQNGYVTGWGTIHFGGPVSQTLQEVVVPVWTPDDCSNAYPGKVFPGMMCAGSKQGGKDSCQGDSGGPFQVQDPRSRRWYVAGVVSWGIRCAQKENPGVYTEVTKYLDWIQQNARF